MGTKIRQQQQKMVANLIDARCTVCLHFRLLIRSFIYVFIFIFHYFTFIVQIQLYRNILMQLVYYCLN